LDIARAFLLITVVVMISHAGRGAIGQELSGNGWLVLSSLRSTCDELNSSTSVNPPTIHRWSSFSPSAYVRFHLSIYKSEFTRLTRPVPCVAQSSDDLMFLKVRFSLGVALGFECVSRCLISPPTLCTGRRDHRSYANAKTG
jgi:hypothetical protein